MAVSFFSGFKETRSTQRDGSNVQFKFANGWTLSLAPFNETTLCRAYAFKDDMNDMGEIIIGADEVAAHMQKIMALTT